MQKRVNKYFLVIFFSFFVNFLFSQVLTKSTEYNDKKKRRDLYYDENLNLIKEDYYTVDQKIVNHIEYDTKGNVNRFISFDESGKVKLDVNFILGTYIYPKNRIELKFKGDYIFEGIQKGDKFIVNYANGKKNGVFLQTDSAVVGSKSIAVQKVDPRFLRFNILKYYVDSESESVYKLFNGVRLNYKNNVLEGSQNSYYSNGNIKFKSFYHNGIIYEHEYFDESGNLISKVLSDNGVLKKPVLKNGVPKKFDNSTALINPTLNEVGDIKRNYILNLDNGSIVINNGSNDFVKLFTESLIDGAGNYIKISDFLKQNAFLDIEPNSFKFSDRNNRELTHNNFAVKKIKNSLQLKKIFDDKKLFVSANYDILRVILSIPIFELNRFDFKNEEDLVPVPVVNTNDSIIANKLFMKYNSFNKFYKGDYEMFSFNLSFIDRSTVGEGPLDANSELSDNKAYLSYLIKKMLYNVFEFENGTGMYIDPFETNLFNHAYNYKNFKIGLKKIGYNYGEVYGKNNSDSIKIFSDDCKFYVVISDKYNIMFSDSVKKYTFYSSEDQNGGYKVDKILLSENGIDFLFNPDDKHSSVNDS